MTKGAAEMGNYDKRRSSQRGQVLVIVAFGMVVLIAMVGLVLDGGSTFAQRRAQQRGADLAALAGANELLLRGSANAQSVAESVATQNGYDPAVVTVRVAVTPFQNAGGKVKVDISMPHQNGFSTIVGMNSWDVSVSATAVAGFVTGASGSGPMMFSSKDFQANGEPLPQYTAAGCPPAPVTSPQNGCPFGTTNGDAPAAGGNDLAWTNFGTGNVDTSQVSQIISGELVIDKTAILNEYIGQHNNGYHAALFTDVQDYLAGTDVLVAITTEQSPGIPDGPASCGGGTPAGGGCFQGWAIFHVVVAVKGSDKHVYGYFVSSKFAPGATVEDCAPAACPRSYGNNYGMYLME